MALGFIDCHCHISAEEFISDIDEVIERAKKAGVKALVAVTENGNEFERVIAISRRYCAFIVPCFGIHPVQGAPPHKQCSATLKDLEPVLPLFSKYKDELAGIGEVGLDFTPWYASSSEQREEQMDVFRKQLEIAKQLDLPVNVHSRSAGQYTISCLKEQGIQKALLHNFAGRPSVALEGIQAGYYFSFPPAVSLSEQRVKLIRQIPLEHICLETDSPALGPDKKERNEPKNISISCEYIAKVKNISADKVMEVTSANAISLFPKILKAVKL